jgi:hypothetical protein
MHVNRKSKGNSVQRYALEPTRHFDESYTQSFGKMKFSGGTLRALKSKWYNAKARVATATGHTFLPFAIALKRGLV